MRCDHCGFAVCILHACRAPGCSRQVCGACRAPDGACARCERDEQVAGRRPIRCDDLGDELIAALLSGADFGVGRPLPLISEPICPASGEPADECDHLTANEASDHA